MRCFSTCVYSRALQTEFPLGAATGLNLKFDLIVMLSYISISLTANWAFTSHGLARPFVQQRSIWLVEYVARGYLHMLMEYQPTTDELMTESGAQAADVIKVLRRSVVCVCHKQCETKFNLVLPALTYHSQIRASRWQGCFLQADAARQRLFFRLIARAQPAAQVEQRRRLSASLYSGEHQLLLWLQPLCGEHWRPDKENKTTLLWKCLRKRLKSSLFGRFGPPPTLWLTVTTDSQCLYVVNCGNNVNFPL